MGRPVNKRWFGNPATKDGPQFYVQADIGAGEEQCFIVSQRATRTFRVESVNSGDQAEVQLVNGPSEVTGAGYGYIEVGTTGGNGEINSVTVNAGGDGYDVADTLTISGGTGTSATVDVDEVGTVQGQDETNFDGAGSNGTFTGGDGAGGTAYVVADTITLSDGTVITVDAIDANDDVTEFTVTTASTSGQTANAQTLTQASSSGSGTGFDLTLGLANQAVFAASIATEGDYSALPSSPAGHSGGTGTGATFNLSTSSTTDEYASRLYNKTVRVFGVSTGKQSYAVNNDPIAGQDLNHDRNASGA